MRTHQCTTTIDDPNNLRATIGGWSRSVTTPSVATELEILFLTVGTWNKVLFPCMHPFCSLYDVEIIPGVQLYMAATAMAKEAERPPPRGAAGGGMQKVETKRIECPEEQHTCALLRGLPRTHGLRKKAIKLCELTGAHPRRHHVLLLLPGSPTRSATPSRTSSPTFLKNKKTPSLRGGGASCFGVRVACYLLGGAS